MIAKAQAIYIRITPRKFRQIVPLIKGRRAEEAIAVLMSVKKRASGYAIELLKSAVANAKRSHEGIDVSNLYVSKVIANCGPSLKRFRAASMGRASPIIKRTSHLLVELDEVKGRAGAKPAPKKEVVEVKAKGRPKRAKGASAKA